MTWSIVDTDRTFKHRFMAVEKYYFKVHENFQPKAGWNPIWTLDTSELCGYEVIRTFSIKVSMSNK